LSFFSGKDDRECWVYFDRHLAYIPNETNRLAGRRYLREREENIELSTLGSYLCHIKAFGIYLGHRDWKDATRDDVIEHIKSATGQQGRVGRGDVRRGRPLGQYTKYQRMVMLREFYKWLLETEETPPQFRRMPFVKPTMEEQSASREDRLRVDEVMDMLTAAKDPMERAVVMLLLDSGFRAGEAAALDIRDVTFDDHGARLMHGREARGLKTLRRKVPTRLTIGARHVREWIAAHPFRLHPERPLFISRSNRNLGQRLGAGGIWGIVSRLARRAKIRHVHPHMFRHTAASLRAADGWNEEMLRLHFGWSKGSEMPSLYTHVEEDYDRFALRKAGIEAQVAKPQWTLQCPHCKTDCPGDSFFCTKCGKAIHESGGAAA
jgi:integrase/recombinase XerD